MSSAPERTLQMTFEATPERDRAEAAPETAPFDFSLRSAPRNEKPLDTMMGFVDETEAMATQLRGLAALFRGVFCDDEVRRSDDAAAAADIVDDCMKSIAARIDVNADHARAARDRLARGAA